MGFASLSDPPRWLCDCTRNRRPCCVSAPAARPACFGSCRWLVRPRACGSCNVAGASVVAPGFV
eukprot:scaffold23232_cov131-Isochrysis_galbana.AAC.2